MGFPGLVVFQALARLPWAPLVAPITENGRDSDCEHRAAGMLLYTARFGFRRRRLESGLGCRQGRGTAGAMGLLASGSLCVREAEEEQRSFPGYGQRGRRSGREVLLGSRLCW